MQPLSKVRNKIMVMKQRSTKEGQLNLENQLEVQHSPENQENSEKQQSLEGQDSPEKHQFLEEQESLEKHGSL